MPQRTKNNESPVWLRNLQYLLEEQGINPRQLSLRAGLNPTAVRDMLSGRAKSPRYETLQAIAKVLDTTPAWLMGDAVIRQDLRRGDKNETARLELLTEIIARLQETAQDMKKKLSARELASMATTLYRQIINGGDPANLSRAALTTHAKVMLAATPLKARRTRGK